MRINSKQRTKSILLGAAGLLLVVIGIVAGKLILSMVVKNVKSSLCVDSTAHESFQDWVSYVFICSFSALETKIIHLIFVCLCLLIFFTLLVRDLLFLVVFFFFDNFFFPFL